MAKQYLDVTGVQTMSKQIALKEQTRVANNLATNQAGFVLDARQGAALLAEINNLKEQIKNMGSDYWGTWTLLDTYTKTYTQYSTPGEVTFKLYYAINLAATKVKMMCIISTSSSGTFASTTSTTFDVSLNGQPDEYLPSFIDQGIDIVSNHLVVRTGTNVVQMDLLFDTSAGKWIVRVPDAFAANKKYCISEVFDI